MSRQPGEGNITKTVLHFLNIEEDEKIVVLITNEVDAKFIYQLMEKQGLDDSCLKNKKLRILGWLPEGITAITFESNIDHKGEK